MSIILVGMNHKTAPVEMRERLAFNETCIPDALSRLVDQQSVDEGLIVSTCNRVELVASSPSGPQMGLERLTGFLCDFHRLPINSINGHLYRLTDTDAVKHLFRVASSLDSLVVGESQILGQVKEAYRTATSAGTVGRVLSQLMHHAISVAKRVRTETAISQNPVSISSVAVELALKIFNHLADKTVLLVGAGEMGQLAAQNLIDAGASKLIVTNRTAERAEAVARQFGGGAINFEAFYDMLPAADIVICSTGAADYMITYEETRQAFKSRRKGPALFIDISVPRNIDPEIARIESAFLFDVDDLESVVKANMREREREAAMAEHIVETEVQQFVKHLRSLDIGPGVQEVKELISQMAVSEFRRNRKRMGEMTPSQEDAILNILIPALVNKLSHPVIVHLKNAARDGEVTEALNDLRKMIRIE